MNIGYACMTVGVPFVCFKSCMLKNAREQNLNEIICANLNTLDRIINYNIKNDIKLFRLSSDLIPFASHGANTIPWWNIYKSELTAIGKKIKDHHIRVSMHPAQYTIINSPSPSVVDNAIADLVYHNRFLNALTADCSNKIVLHIGGVYGNKTESKKRFVSNFLSLPDDIKSRIIIENDEKFYSIQDLLEIGTANGIPVVYDNLHNEINPCDPNKTDNDWIKLCAATWKHTDGAQKIHYAQQDETKKKGAHSVTIKLERFLDFYQSLDNKNIDIMLEVKDKNLSANKCINATTQNRSIAKLEAEWSHYKYKVLECSHESYDKIRALLKDKNGYPVKEFYHVVESALARGADKQGFINACQHIWGYFKDKAPLQTKNAFLRKLELYQSCKCSYTSIKNYLYRLAILYEEHYLLNSYFFYV